MNIKIIIYSANVSWAGLNPFASPSKIVVSARREPHVGCYCSACANGEDLSVYSDRYNISSVDSALGNSCLVLKLFDLLPTRPVGPLAIIFGYVKGLV